MPTPIGSGPNGGILMQDDDGSHYEVKGNTMTPVAPPAPDDTAPTTRPGLGGAIQSGINGFVEGLSRKEPPLDPNHPTMNNLGRTVGSTISSALSPVTAAKQASDVFTAPAPQPSAPSMPEAPVVDIKEQPKAPAPAPTLPPVGAGGGGVSAPQVNTKDFDAATTKAQDALKREGEAKAAAARGVGDEWTKQAEAAQKRLDDFQKMVAAQQAEGQKRLDDENAEIAKLGSGKVDPDHFWKSKGAGAKVLGGISLFLGGLAHGMGAENVGAKMIADDVERDIASQKFNIEQAGQDQRARLAAKSTAFGHFLSLTGDTRAAAMAANAWGLDQAKLKVEGLKASLSAPAEIAAADKLAAELGQKSAEYKNQAVVQNSQLKTQALAQQGQALSNEGQRLQLQAQRAALAAQQAGALPPEQRERAIFRKEGSPILVADKEEARRLRPMVASADETLHEIDRAKKLLGQFGSSMESVNPEAYGEYQAAMDTIIKNINESEGIKQALQKTQVGLYTHALGNDKLKPKASTLASLLGVARAVRGSVNSNLVASGGQAIYGEEPTEAQAAALKKAGR